MREALIWLDCTDPVESTDADAQEDNPEMEELSAVLSNWPGGPGPVLHTPGELIAVGELRDPSNYQLRYPNWATVLTGIAANRVGKFDAKTLGLWLKKHKDRVVNSLKLEQKGPKGRRAWKVTQR